MGIGQQGLPWELVPPTSGGGSRISLTAEIEQVILHLCREGSGVLHQRDWIGLEWNAETSLVSHG